jgi:hypothetical protein
MFWPERATRGEIQKAYRQNLRLVLDHVADLLAAIEGKVIVTADHGEMLGERLRPIPVRCYDHHPSLYVPELVEVPWLEVSSDSRRSVRPDPPEEVLSIDEESRTRRLRALGYIE